MFRKCLLLAAIVAPMLVACGTTYEYVPPKTDQGRQCAAQCGAAQETCRSSATAQADRNEARCERESSNDYTTCLIIATTTEQKAACGKKRRYCGHYADTSTCEKAYRNCFVTCGGQVIERED